MQIGSALGSVIGQLLRVTESQLRLLVACGAAAGISATFNAPIAGCSILPLMFAIVVATALSIAITKDTIYTLKLRRRGIDIDVPRTPSRMAQITVADAMGRAFRPLKPDQPLHEIIARFAAEPTDSLPVTNGVGSLTGIIAASDVERALSHGSDGTMQGAKLARDVHRLRASDALEDAVQALGATDDEGLPVIGEDDRLIGWVTHRRVLRAYLTRFGAPEDTGRELAPPPELTGSATPADGPRR